MFSKLVFLTLFLTSSVFAASDRGILQELILWNAGLTAEATLGKIQTSKFSESDVRRVMLNQGIDELNKLPDQVAFVIIAQASWASLRATELNGLVKEFADLSSADKAKWFGFFALENSRQVKVGAFLNVTTPAELSSFEFQTLKAIFGRVSIPNLSDAKILEIRNWYQSLVEPKRSQMIAISVAADLAAIPNLAESLLNRESGRVEDSSVTGGVVLVGGGVVVWGVTSLLGLSEYAMAGSVFLVGGGAGVGTGLGLASIGRKANRLKVNQIIRYVDHLLQLLEHDSEIEIDSLLATLIVNANQAIENLVGSDLYEEENNRASVESIYRGVIALSNRGQAHSESHVALAASSRAVGFYLSQVGGPAGRFDKQPLQLLPGFCQAFIAKEAAPLPLAEL